MAFLSPKKKTVEKKPKKEVSAAKSEGSFAPHLSDVLVRPRITEKATDLVARSKVYTFDVKPKATKSLISKAIKQIYKVTPVKVAVVSVPSKKIFVRGKWGRTVAGKKAYVYLKEGDKIEFV
jgi:large subunit ribosomal protein L23